MWYNTFMNNFDAYPGRIHEAPPTTSITPEQWAKLFGHDRNIVHNLTDLVPGTKVIKFGIHERTDFRGGLLFIPEGSVYEITGEAIKTESDIGGYGSSIEARLLPGSVVRRPHQYENPSRIYFGASNLEPRRLGTELPNGITYGYVIVTDTPSDPGVKQEFRNILVSAAQDGSSGHPPQPAYYVESFYERFTDPNGIY